MRIAILGSGAMGLRMGARLLAAGHELTVYNRTARHSQVLIDQGAMFAATPRLAVGAVEVAISMLRDDAASMEVWCGNDGALTALNDNAVMLECSTVTQSWALRLHELAAQRSALCLDAPVLGSRPQAAAGALIFLVGGSVTVLDAVRDVLACLGGSILHVGAAGQGAALKLLLNALFGIQVAAVSELLLLARQAGLDEQALPTLLEQIPVVSPAARGAINLMLVGKHAPLFPVELVVKDLEYARMLAGSQSARVPLICAAAARFQQAFANGWGGLNLTAVDLLSRRA